MKAKALFLLMLALSLVSFGASAEGDCDYEALLDAALAGEWDWMIGDFSTEDFDAALAAASTTILPIGGSTTFSVEGFEDFVHIIGDCVEIPDDDSAFVAWDHGDGADWTYPDDVLSGDGDENRDLIGDTGRGNSLLGESPYGLFVGFGPGENLNLYIVSSGEAEEAETGYTEGSISSSLTFFEEGANLNLTAKGTAGATPGYTWDFDGGALPGNATADGGVLIIDTLAAGNLGTYTCTWEYGVEAKGTQVASLTIGSLEAAGSVPAVNFLGLGILAVLSALVGAAVIRRRTA